MRMLRDLLRSQSGNVAAIFAIAVVPLLLAVGVAVDMARIYSTHTLLQGAADAAALGGGASSSTSDGQLETIASQYLDANGADRNFTDVSVRKIKNNKGSGVFSVEVKGTMKTSLMALAGLSTVDVRAISEVKRGSAGPLEMVLALDITYSMTENDKIGTLRAAAADLVNKVMVGDVKVGIAPFSDYFKIGTKYKDESWVNVPATVTSEYESCASTTYPNRSGCSIQTTCYYDNIPYECNYENCTNWGEPVKTGCSMVTDVNSWDGCVAARPAAYHDSIDDVNVPYPGVLWDCGPALVEMSTDKQRILDAVAGLGTSGNTNIPSGLIWAWNLLTPQAPLTEAATMASVKAKGGKKVMVLMTDGANTVSPYADGNYGDHAYTEYGDGTYTDNLTASLCGKIKAEGTIVYTVLFDVTDPGIETLLRDCASDSSKSYVADDAAELLTAFADIGAALTKLRLTR